MLKIPNLQHALNGKEVLIAGAPVDAVDMVNKIVYQFAGCYWHNCIVCNVNDFTEDHNGQKKAETMAQRRSRTISRNIKIKKLGYKLVEMRECDWIKFLKANTDINEKLEKDPLVQKDIIRGRQTLFGGRTNCCKLYCKAPPGFEIFYFDYTSLYSFCSKYGEFFVKHPIVLTPDDTDISKVNGFVHATVLAPSRLYHPVLPQKINGKLLFHLCRKCAIEKTNIYCDHTDEERSFSGVWSTVELNLALKFNYRIIKIHEMWHFENTMKYVPGISPGLFTEFIDHFLKIKQQASGWPHENMTNDEKSKYIRDYFEHEHVNLDPDSMESNPVMRNLAKISLNSQWGKMAQRKLPLTEIVDSRTRLLRLLNAPNVKVKSVLHKLGSKILVNYEDEATESRNVNVLIASLTTSYARVMLYKLLYIAGELTLYYDTDSIFYLAPSSNPILKTDIFLGSLTNEALEYGEGAKITEFAAAGPKNYSVRLALPDGSEKIIRKVKGITLRHDCKEETSMDTLVKLINGEADEVTVKIINKIQRSSGFQVFSSDTTKKIRLVYDKRARIGQYDTQPWGTKLNATELPPDPSITIPLWEVREHTL